MSGLSEPRIMCKVKFMSDGFETSVFADELTNSPEDVFEQAIASVYGTYTKEENGYYTMTTFGGVKLAYHSAKEGLLDWLDYFLLVYKDDKKAGDINLINYIKGL